MTRPRSGPRKAKPAKRDESRELSIRDLLREAVGRLEVAGVPEPRLEAEVLMRYVTGWDRARLFLVMRDPVTDPEMIQCFQDCVALRAEGCPTAYVTGEREFWSMNFEVDRRVLIPRPETEILVEVALDRTKEVLEGRDSAVFRAADVGTGSGCIACAFAKERPGWRITATDRSADALELAGSNAKRLGLEGRIEFIACDLLEEAAGPFDLIASNPPYVADGEALPREVADWEPHGALFAGPTGYEAIDRLLAAAPGRLADGGAMALEVGLGQSGRVLKSVLALGSWADAGVTRDFAGIERVVWARGWRK